MNEAKKPIALMLAFSMMSLTAGCGGGDGSLDISDPTDTDEPMVGSVPLNTHHTNLDLANDGTVLFHTDGGDGQLLQFQISVDSTDGMAITDGSVHVDRNDDVFAIYYGDELQSYTSALAIGRASDLSGLGTGNVYPRGEKIAFIPLLLIVLAIGAAEVGVIINAYHVDMFYVTDALEEGDDYILYCKSWLELAEFIKHRTLAALGVTSIILSFVSAIGATSTIASSVDTISMATAQHLRDELIAQAMDLWGESAQQIASDPVGVKVYFDGRTGFSNIWNAYTIIPHYDGCLVNDLSIEGTVRSALSGNGIPGVDVVLTGAGNYSTQTNSSGNYSFTGLYPGTYYVMFSKDGYISDTRTVTLTEYPVEINIILSEELDDDEFRFVLEWGATPQDLDAHTWIDPSYHVYYGNFGTLTEPPYASLDLDDLTSYGPETTTVGSLYGDITFAVHNYSNDASLAGCGATVKLYRGNNLYGTYQVPNSGTGRYWHVLDIDLSGTITIRNVITSSSPSKIASVDHIAKP